MEKFYLEIPSIERKKDVLEYIEEHKKNNCLITDINGMNNILDDKFNYEEWLETEEKMHDEEYAISVGLSPSDTYFLIRKNDNKLIGMLSLRYYLNSKLLKCGGNIGYGIRPTERKKGYNKINLYLGLQKAQEAEIKTVTINCDVTNVGSEKTIKALGGLLEKKEIDFDNKVYDIYWIDVNYSLAKYNHTYNKHIYQEVKSKSK